MIFVQPILYNSYDKYFSPLFIGQNNGERKNKRDNKNTCKYERRLFQKLSKNRYTYIISLRVVTSPNNSKGTKVSRCPYVVMYVLGIDFLRFGHRGV